MSGSWRYLLLAVTFSLVVAQDLSAINGLPACGKTCFNNMFGKATSLGCESNNLTCMCETVNFGYGVRDCAAGLCPSTGVTDTSQIISVGNNFCDSALGAGSSSGSSATVVQTDVGGATTAIVLTDTTSSSSEIASPSSISTTSAIAAKGTAATSRDQSPTTASSASNPTNTPAASSGLSSSAKIGIGLGIPLVVIVAAILGFLLYRFRKHKKSSRQLHQGSMVVAGLHPVGDEQEKATGSGSNGSATKELKHDVQGATDEDPVSSVSEVPSKEMKHDILIDDIEGAHEVHGNEVTAYSRELPGSPGVQRSELSERRGSV